MTLIGAPITAAIFVQCDHPRELLTPNDIIKALSRQFRVNSIGQTFFTALPKCNENRYLCLPYIEFIELRPFYTISLSRLTMGNQKISADLKEVHYDSGSLVTS